MKNLKKLTNLLDQKVTIEYKDGIGKKLHTVAGTSGTLSLKSGIIFQVGDDQIDASDTSIKIKDHTITILY